MKDQHIITDLTGREGRETNLLLSQNIKISYNTWLSKLGSLNTLIIGGTGTGKSRGLVKPNIYSLPVDPKTGMPVSLVITDPKGELCNETAGFLADNGYEIKIFNINEMRFSSCYNPFRYIHKSEDLLIMMDAVVDNANGGKQPSDPHWTNSAKSLLNAIGYLVYYEFKFENQNFNTVSQLLNLCGSSENDDNYKSEFDKILDAIVAGSPMGEDHPAMVWRKKVSAKGGEMSSIISTAQTAVRLFASKDVQRLTDVDTIALDEIGDRPTAVYLIIPTTNSTYNFLISLFYTQLFESLYFRAQNKYDGSLPHHVTIWADEFANIGKIPDFDRKIATFRSVNISVCMIVQSPNQLTTLYDKAAPDILDNVHITIFIGSGGLDKDKSASAYMSNALGKKTIQAEQTSVRTSQKPTMVGIGDTSIEHSYSATERPLMTPDEIFRLEGDRSIVLIAGRKPFFDYKIDPDKCLNFSSDRYSVVTPTGRKLKKEYEWPVNDKDPSRPARRRTYEEYRKGLMHAEEVDKEQAAQRRRDREEDEKYNPVPNRPPQNFIANLEDRLNEEIAERFETEASTFNIYDN